MKKLPLAIGLVLLQAATLAAAQSASRATDENADRSNAPAQTGTQNSAQPGEPDNPLAGPAIEQAEADTLVAYEYTGQLQELGLPPAEAALELLSLDPETAERVAEVLAARAALAEQLIINNFELVSQAETIEASDSKLEKGVFFLQVVRALHPLIDRGPLEDEIREVLPEQAAQHFDALLDEYWQALGKARVADAERAGERLRLRKAIREARRDQLGKEIELAAQRALESERFVIDYLTKGLDLSDAQHERIKKLILAFAARTAGDAGQEEKNRLFAEVIAYLNEDQRALIIKRIQGL